MKKSILLLIILILVKITAQAQTEKQFKFEIDGTIKADSGKITLMFESDYNENKLGKLVTTVKNNKFSFSGFLSEPQGVTIYSDGGYRSAPFVIENGVQTVAINKDERDKVPDVSNSIMQKEYPLYLAFFKQHKRKRDTHDQKYNKIYRDNNYILPEDIRFKMEKELDILHKEHDKLLLSYTEKNPKSEIAFWRLVSLMGWGYEPIFDSIYDAFSDNLKNGDAGRVLKSKLLEGKQLSVGKHFPLIQCVNKNNEPFALDLFTDNTFTLVDFWYSGCGPCRAQFEKLKDLHSQFNTKGFEIVAISIDKERDKQKWENVIETEKLIWKQYWDMNGEESKRLSVRAFPTNFLIDKDGKIIAKNIPLGELNLLLNEKL
ncbi:TlpA disulfide reductase family protein [Persicobacter diffluens]|uniref:Thiol:disulfide interchange protein n=1 Tax=Persicobacter diffluens TaxID=981 RepID=A0AAN4W372_9BACT|nr:thiol:disulfide interchange protein [Persicobacter diffluens]